MILHLPRRGPALSLSRLPEKGEWLKIQTQKTEKLKMQCLSKFE